MFIVLNCNELAGISDFGEKSAQVVSATRWQPAAGIAPRTLRIAGASPLAANNQRSASGIHFRGM
jgi:hypothetical protein